jgi:hypothetical protein
MQLLTELKNENKITVVAEENETSNETVEENIFGEWLRYANLPNQCLIYWLCTNKFLQY